VHAPPARIDVEWWVAGLYDRFAAHLALPAVERAAVDERRWLPLEETVRLVQRARRFGIRGLGDCT
jgi:hypothetical protein